MKGLENWKDVTNMNHKDFAEYLNDYSEQRKGEISWLTKSASYRISILNARVDELEKIIDLQTMCQRNDTATR